MDGAHALLVVLLVLDGLQAAAAGAALAHGRLRRSRGDHVLAGYSFRHAGLLLAGAGLLAVPLVLGLAGVLAPRTAVWVVIGAEAAGVVAARVVLERLHAAVHG
jgi:hypothetical protein